MRRLLRFSILLFAVSLAVFAVYEIRTVSKRDSAAPVITMEEDELYVSIHDGEDIFLRDVTAYDRRDGDVTKSLVVESLSTFYKTGTRIITYAAFDRDNHVTRRTRDLIYTDYYEPEFTIRRPLVFSLGSTGILDYVTATDCIDGSLTDHIKLLTDDELVVDREGDYKVKLQVANSAGDVVTLPVIVTMKGNPDEGAVIELSGYVQYLNPGDSFDAYSYIKDIAVGNRKYDIVSGNGNYGTADRSVTTIAVGTNLIAVDSDVDPGTPGSYTVTYSVRLTDSSGNVTEGVQHMYVVVREIPREE